MSRGDGNTEASDRRKKKKQYYAKVIREEKAREEERAKKYRDRARERREVTANDDQFSINASINAAQQAASTGNYKSVAPDAKGNFDAAARRKQQIDESKFLGGDLEHTHLVKGLDYALLQKVCPYSTQTKRISNIDVIRFERKSVRMMWMMIH